MCFCTYIIVIKTFFHTIWVTTSPMRDFELPDYWTLSPRRRAQIQRRGLKMGLPELVSSEDGSILFNGTVADLKVCINLE